MEPVSRAGQLHLRKGSRARVFKLHMVGAGQGHLKEINMHGDQFFIKPFYRSGSTESIPANN